MPRPNLRVTSVTIGSLQPCELARFYADLLGWRLRCERCFQRPVWPAEEGKQTASQHRDIHIDDLAAAVNWA